MRLYQFYFCMRFFFMNEPNISLSVDASTIGQRSRLIGLIARPDGHGVWLPPQACRISHKTNTPTRGYPKHPPPQTTPAPIRHPSRPLGNRRPVRFFFLFLGLVVQAVAQKKKKKPYRPPRPVRLYFKTKPHRLSFFKAGWTRMSRTRLGR